MANGIKVNYGTENVISQTAGLIPGKTATLNVAGSLMSNNLEIEVPAANAEATYVLNGKTFYGANGLETGTMEDAGYTDSSSTITLSIDHPEVALEGAYRGTAKIYPEVKTITANGTYTPSAGSVISKVVVSVDDTPALQEKIATPTKSTQAITADSGYYGLSKVTVNAIPSNYITTTDATAGSADILFGKTAYVGGTKVTGTMEDRGYTGGDSTITLTPSYTSDRLNGAYKGEARVYTQAAITITPSSEAQTVRSTDRDGWLTSVTVQAVPMWDKSYTIN